MRRMSLSAILAAVFTAVVGSEARAAIPQSERAALPGSSGDPAPVLSVTLQGSGQGVVTSSPDGIACGADCSESYAPGTVVSLAATPSAGSSFAGWSGGCTGTGACTVTLAGGTWVRASFEGTPPAGAIAVLRPGGDEWTAGSSVPVQWSGTGASGFDLELWKGSAPYRALASAVAGTQYAWASPAWLPPGTDYRIRVADHGDPRRQGLSSWFAVVDGTSAYGSLGGFVRTASTGAPVAGATVQCGTLSAAGGSDGTYVFASLPAASYTCTASAPGYLAATLPVTVPTRGDVRRDFSLPVASGALRVVDVSHRWKENVYFLSGASQNVSLTATVDWGGLSPGAVLFSTPSGRTSVPATASRTTDNFDAGQLPACAGMKVQAQAASGATSAAVQAPFSAMSRPAFIPVALTAHDAGDGLYYRSGVSFDLDLVDEAVEAGTIPGDIPFFGANPIALQLVPSVIAQLTSAGEASLELDWANPDMKKQLAGRVAGFEFPLAPRVAARGQWAPCEWQWGGEVGASASFEGAATEPFVLLAGPIPVPMFLAGSVEVKGDFALQVKDLEPVTLGGTFELNPSLRGSLGAGVDRATAVEGWVGGGATLSFQYPETPHLENAVVYVDGGVSIDVFGWTWENELLRWDWELYSGVGPDRLRRTASLPARPRLLSRDYLRATRDGEALLPAPPSPSGGPGSGPRRAAMQLSTLPHPQPQLSASGGHTYAVWLVDGASRAPVNRTKAVFGSFDGTSWSSPQAVLDDGTADFDPRVAAFDDGRAWVIWEDANRALPSDAQFQDTVGSLEIRAALYDPALPGFAATYPLSSNAYLDATPSLSGPSADDVVAVWIANSANAVLGSAGEPNRLYVARWNGTAWSTPELVGQVPRPVLRCESLYDGTTIDIVLGVDLDGDTGTVADQELTWYRKAGGVWQVSGQWLTSNSVVDANPRLAKTPGGSTLLAWVRGDTLHVARDFAVASPAYSWKGLYSTSYADFDLVRGDDGRLAVVWTQPSRYSSDIWALFYDPATDTWGDKVRLTADADTEKDVASALVDASLVSLYARRQLGLTTRDRTLADGRVVSFEVPVPGPTDLYMLRVPLSPDAALVEGTFSVAPPNPSPGTPATLAVTVGNRGELPVPATAVAFYKGDPTAGGVEIGRVALPSATPAGRLVPVSLGWTVPPTAAPLDLFAVVDPGGATTDRDRTNNTLRTVIALPDLQVSQAGWGQQSGHLVSIGARVTNNGSVPSAATSATFRRRSASGAVLHEAAVPALQPGQSVDVGFVADLAGWRVGRNVVVVVDEDHAIAEYDEGNNTASIGDGGKPGSVQRRRRR